jgi:tetratricopeptide (TPR) repeat protein
MTNQNKLLEGPGFFGWVKRLWGPITLLAACFWGGFWVKSEIDTGKVEQMEMEIDFYRNKSAEAENIEDFFAKFDIAQMSPRGENQLLFGNSSIGCNQSPITSAIDSAFAAISRDEYVQAIAKLKEAQNIMPNFPFTYFYLGIAELSNVPSRAAPYFRQAHGLFTSLLRIKPNNASMRLCDAMALTYLGSGDSATMQLYRTHEYDPEWSILGCEKTLLMYDSTVLSKEELQSWHIFMNTLGSMKCDTTKLSRGSVAIDVSSPLPEIPWPTGYDHLDK